MSGIAEIDGRSYGEISATTADTWAHEVAERAKLLGMKESVAKWLYNHVEMKAVVMMIQSGATYGRVIINHAPCGSEPGARGGCHRYLPYFLPRGSSLTVLGTDANGQPFRREYEGKADK
ncbi:DddA-like double-stranded DNA deaminase toxin [Actinokineospora sp.]|uniref:DddA-like double-stranded DNA deaminase toxin n=1 Tax=Actinokineospora sp. TaxID=1872133 RepID=UPI00403766ED